MLAQNVPNWSCNLYGNTKIDECVHVCACVCTLSYAYYVPLLAEYWQDSEENSGLLVINSNVTAET